MKSNARLSASVHGRVQGVYFRGFVQEHALNLSIVGYAKNLPNGTTVEVQAEGEKPALEMFLRLLTEGPPGSLVRNVEATWSTPTGEYDSFKVF